MIKKISGPLVVAEVEGAKKGDLVRLGAKRLLGEVVELRGKNASIQVYEETSGLKVGDESINTGSPLSVELAPGLVGEIFDGIQRPLKEIVKASGFYMERGIEISSVSRQTKWSFSPLVKEGEDVGPGDIIGQVQETPLILHKVMVPHGVSGKVETIKAGAFSVDETVAVVAGTQISMLQKWPVRKRRTLKEKAPVDAPLVTGQRIIDTFFPIAKGGAACAPGPFGAGKTVIQHQMAKWSDADLIVFVGCGERGNEMTDVLKEFPTLKDARTGRPLMEKTILIANTSNMPIAAREASVYTGAAIAEYFRDMGYNVAMMADSTSRWAEALREMSGRLEEMPGEEGYPAYLGSRLADFYERSGRGKCFGRPERDGSLTLIGSVSPPGGDLSEPVVQNTLRVTKVFWALDEGLAHKRHFPAINWLLSYSLYAPNLAAYFSKEVAVDLSDIREEAMKLLAQEAELEEIVRLVGLESLSKKEQLVLFASKMIREDFLYQSAFDPVDQYSSLKKQYFMLKAIVEFFRSAASVLEDGVELEQIRKSPAAGLVAGARFISDADAEKLVSEVINHTNALRTGGHHG